MTPTAPLHIAQLTDTHLFADTHREMLGVCTFETFRSVVEQVAKQTPRPDLLLLTGDLSQDETAASYERIREAIAALDIPTYCIPGNHDQPELMEQIFNTAPFSTKMHVQMGGWNFILLNTAASGSVHGVLTEQALHELDAKLKTVDQRPTLIALHHPPVPIGSEWMDRIGLHNPERFHAIIQQACSVKIVLFGHIHQAFEAIHDGVQFLGSPSTCVQFAPQSTEFAIDTQVPGFRWLTLYPDGSYTTDIRRVPQR